MTVYIRDVEGSKGIFEVTEGYSYDEIYQAITSLGVDIQVMLYSVNSGV